MTDSRLSDLTTRFEHDQQARAFVEYARALGLARGDKGIIGPILERRLGARSSSLQLFYKSTVATFGASATDALCDALRLGAAFVGLTRQQTILGQLAGTVSR